LAIVIKTEWLVRLVDRVGTTELKNAKLTKRGDVVVIKPAPCKWTKKEINNPDWIIIKTDMTYEDATLYTHREYGEFEEVPLLKARNKALTLDVIEVELDSDQKLKYKHPYIEPMELSQEALARLTEIKEAATRNR